MEVCPDLPSAGVNRFRFYGSVQMYISALLFGNSTKSSLVEVHTLLV